VKAKDYSSIAKKEHLKPIETELRKMNDVARETLKYYENIRDSEEKIYSDTASTNTRTIVYGIIMTLILITLSLFQMYQLKSFFKKKKII